MNLPDCKTYQTHSARIEPKRPIQQTSMLTTTPPTLRINLIKVPYLTRINEKKAINRKRLMLPMQQLFHVGNCSDALHSTLMEHKKFQLLGNNSKRLGACYVCKS